MSESYIPYYDLKGMQRITNNLGNIRYNSKNAWLGQTGSYRGFCKFENIEYGIRAMLVLIKNYISHGFNIPVLIISRYAPQFENDTSAYIEFVCKKSDYLFPYNIIKSDFDLCCLVKYMILYESSVDVPVAFVEYVAGKYSIHL